MQRVMVDPERAGGVRERERARARACDRERERESVKDRERERERESERERERWLSRNEEAQHERTEQILKCIVPLPPSLTPTHSLTHSLRTHSLTLYTLTHSTSTQRVIVVPEHKAIWKRESKFITMIKWIRTSRLSIKNSLSLCPGTGAARAHRTASEEHRAPLRSPVPPTHPPGWLVIHPWPAWKRLTIKKITIKQETKQG